MGVWRRLESWLSWFPWYRRRAREADLARELRGHLELEAEEQRAAGLSPEEAGHAAHRALGNELQVEEDVRAAWGFVWVETLLQDFRFGLRMLRKSPGFTLATVLTLAIGVGANTTIFSMVDGLLLRPLPAPAPRELVVLGMRQEGQPASQLLSYPDFRDIRRQTTGIFSGLVAHRTGLDGLRVHGRPDRVVTNYVTGNCFTVLGLKPALGRLLLPSEGKFPGVDPVLVLGYSYWKVHFAGDLNMVGRAASIDGQPVTIVGVAPKKFHGLQWPLDVQAYLPLDMLAREGWLSKNFTTDRSYRNFSVLARLRPGISLERAHAALRVVAARLAQAHPKSDRNIQLTLTPEILSKFGFGAERPIMSMAALFLVLALVVLVLACINVAGVVLVRAMARQREMALRAALGATRFRLVRQLVVETVLIGLAGGLVGVCVGGWVAARMDSVDLHFGVPLSLGLKPDWTVFAYGLAIALLCGLAVGIVPAFRASRTNLNETLHEGGQRAGRRQRLRSTLVIAEVAGSLTLLVVAGSFVRSMDNAGQINLGFDPHHVVTVSMDPHEAGYTDTRGQEFYTELLRRLRALPAVRSASESCCVPLGSVFRNDQIAVPGYQPPQGQQMPAVSFSNITPGYFQTLHIPILRGRSFTQADDAHAQLVAVINQTMANTFWPKQNPIGQHFSRASKPGRRIEVVGVAKNGKYQSIFAPVQPYYYVPLAQHYFSLGTVLVRSSLPAASMLETLRGQIAALAPSLPIFGAQTMDQSVGGIEGLRIFRLAAALSGTLGFLGLVLVVIGVYGVVSSAASQKTHEIGVRMAIGARPDQVRWMILRQGLLIVSIGLALGLLLSLAAGRVVGRFLVGVSGNDPFTLAGGCVLLAAVVLVACYIPASRAMRVDPATALRSE